MKYNVKVKGLMIDSYPDLLMSSVFAGDNMDDVFSIEEWDMLLRFSFLFSDPESPITEKTVDRRIKACISYLKVHEEKVLAVINSLEHPITAMITDFLKTVSPALYEDWFSQMVNFWRISEYLRSPLDIGKPSEAKVRSELPAMMGGLRKSISDIEEQLFPAGVAKEASRTLGVRLLTGYAEKYAQDRND